MSDGKTATFFPLEWWENSTEIVRAFSEYFELSDERKREGLSILKEWIEQELNKLGE